MGDEVPNGTSSSLPELAVVDPTKEGVSTSLPLISAKSPVRGMLHAKKSNSMLTELQDYIKGVEAIAAARKEQLERIYEEKRNEERKDRMMKQNCRSHENDFASFSNMVDVPSKVRALHEDVKNQKDKVRKYKEKCLVAERTVVAQQREIIRMEEKSKVLQEALNAVGKSPKQVFDEQSIMTQLEDKDKSIQDLEHRLRVVMRSRETDFRKFKMERAMERRSNEQLQYELADLRLELEDKDKGIRMGAMKIKTLAKEVEPLRRQLLQMKTQAFRPQANEVYNPTSGLFLTQMSDEFGGQNVLHNDDHIQLMICVVKDDGRTKGKVIITKDQEEAAAAVKIQSHVRGHQARQQLRGPQATDRPDSGGEAEAAEQESVVIEEEKNAAATKIQALHRGKTARKEVEKIKVEKEAAAVEEAKKAEEVKQEATKKETKKGSLPAGKPKGGRPNMGGAKKPVGSGTATRRGK